MSTKNISITEEAYKRLANMKKANESFSEIILEVTGKKRLNDFFGILSEKSALKLENNIEDIRGENRKLRKSRDKKLKGMF